MCGIFGYSGRSEAPALERAQEAMAYRGHDARGVFQGEGMLMAHARLSIIALADGAQPMTEASGRHTLVFNGELYNYLELRRELEAEGEVFRTASDTEVLLVGLVRYGARFVARAEGMFAFALWDSTARRLMLGRDLLGKKPLHVWTGPDGSVAFSSSLHSFRHLPGWTGRTSPLGLALYMAKQYIPAPASIFEGCRKVQPGFLEIWDARSGEWTRERFRSFHFAPSLSRVLCSGSARELMLSELRRSLAVRCRADVPMGLTFSGGVDSGLLACLLWEAGVGLPLFNVDYDIAGNRSPERRNARIVAERLGFPLIEINFRPGNLFLALPQAYRHYDEPCNQLPMVYYFEMCQRIKQAGVTVVLGGNGPDEVFFGYNGNHMFRRHNFMVSRLPNMLPRFLLPNRHAAICDQGWERHVSGDMRGQLLEAGRTLGVAREELVGEMEPFLGALAAEVQDARFSQFQDYFAWHELRVSGACNGNYTLPDINGMQAQVEVRSPFLDQGFLNAAGRLHIRHKIGSMLTDRHNKSVLKKLYAERVGADIAYDDKRGLGWNIRFDLWIRQEPLVRDLFQGVLRRLGDFGIDSGPFVRAHETFCDFDRYGGVGGDVAVGGFMLACWFIKEFEGEESLAEAMEATRSFSPRATGAEA